MLIWSLPSPTWKLLHAIILFRSLIFSFGLNQSDTEIHMEETVIATVFRLSPSLARIQLLRSFLAGSLLLSICSPISGTCQKQSEVDLNG